MSPHEHRAIIGHGIDLVEIARIEHMLADHGEQFLARVFTLHEQDAAGALGKRRVEGLAARFAAKEATLKAIGTGLRSRMCWTDIEVVTLPSGAPSVRVSGEVARVSQQQGIARWSISLSHAGGFAVASVLALSGSTAE
jgi:holo-[acyl-carrier protein] synthase